MSTVNVPSIGLAGDVIDADALNAAFSSFETTINQVNLRPDAIHTYHMQTSAIQQQADNVSNTSDTFVTYTGTTYQAITHGTNPLDTGLILLPANSTLRVHWHQYLDTFTIATPDADRFASFQMEWDIGAGWTSLPDLLAWAVFPYQTSFTVAAIDETQTHSITGSWWYTNDTGSTITILGIRVLIRPSDSIPGDSVDLGEGNISHIILLR